MTAALSVVFTVWNRNPALLHNSLWTLSHQTTPPAEVIVTDQTPDAGKRQETQVVCGQYPIARYIATPSGQFSMSRGFNVGIRASREDSAQVFCGCSEMYFSPTLVERVMEQAGRNTVTYATTGFLARGLDLSGGPEWTWKVWDWLIGQIEPPLPVPCSTGTLICAPREWWHRVRGYDEIRRPFAYADGDVSYRARIDGLATGCVGWGEAQCLHPWHEPSPLVYSLGGIWPLPDELDPVRNREWWGEDRSHETEMDKQNARSR